jgi:hypothetical protein
MVMMASCFLTLRDSEGLKTKKLHRSKSVISPDQLSTPSYIVTSPLQRTFVTYLQLKHAYNKCDGTETTANSSQPLSPPLNNPTPRHVPNNISPHIHLPSLLMRYINTVTRRRSQNLHAIVTPREKDTMQSIDKCMRSRVGAFHG